MVVAAGSGTRLGSPLPKAFVDLAGRPVLAHALDGVFAARPAQVVVVAPAGFEDEADAALRAASSRGEREAKESASGHAPTPHRVVTGGATRQQSVAAGLAALSTDAEVVLVHDAARALTPTEQFAAVADAVAPGTGVIPALPVGDSLKRVSGTDVTDAVDRSELVAAQTPQGFARDELVAAFAAASGADHTDDAALYAAAGHRVRFVRGAERAFKITTRADLERARMLLRPAPRVGVGTDAHAFGGEGDLWLAGLEWPGEPALSGHSDGDAVAHAIVDALLSAAGLGDIGEHFGVAQPEFAGAHAAVFLARTRELVEKAGYAIGNVSVQFHGSRPRFAARRGEAEAALSAALGAPVSIAATTTDGLGPTGSGDGIAAFAVALVMRA